MPANLNKDGYLLEFIPARGAIKVSAIDPLTGTEVSIVGSPSATQKQLESVAIRKLKYVLGKADPPPQAPVKRRGIEV